MSSSVPCRPTFDCEQQAEQLNRNCHCLTFSREMMREELLALPDGAEIFRMIVEERPHLLADSPVFIPEDSLRQQARIIQAVERVVALPAYQEQVLRYAPLSARTVTKAHGVFFGYDFHLRDSGPQLIEINSNAGGAMINALLARAQIACEAEAGDRRESASPPMPFGAADNSLEREFLEMFQEEWRAERSERPLTVVAIVDDLPERQFLYPEFLLFRLLFEQNGINALICDPRQLIFDGQALMCGNQPIDLVYNRLTDFGLEAESQRSLRDAYLSGAVVVTPHPRAHALYADKRNLALLSDERVLLELGVDEGTRNLLLSGIARTQNVNPSNAEALWATRKGLFFKPAAGYGSKAAYRGDKMTRRVFEEVLQGSYVTQALIPPSGRRLRMRDLSIEMKVDLRNYVYRGRVQSITTRLYQGQTTNFRTPGGGFAPVVVIPCSDGGSIGRGLNHPG